MAHSETNFFFEIVNFFFKKAKFWLNLTIKSNLALVKWCVYSVSVYVWQRRRQMQILFYSILFDQSFKIISDTQFNCSPKQMFHELIKFEKKKTVRSGSSIKFFLIKHLNCERKLIIELSFIFAIMIKFTYLFIDVFFFPLFVCLFWK